MAKGFVVFVIVVLSILNIIVGSVGAASKAQLKATFPTEVWPLFNKGFFWMEALGVFLIYFNWFLLLDEQNRTDGNVTPFMIFAHIIFILGLVGGIGVIAASPLTEDFKGLATRAYVLLPFLAGMFIFVALIVVILITQPIKNNKKSGGSRGVNIKW